MIFSDADYCIGLNDIEKAITWRWVNGHRTATNNVTLWAPGEPNNHRENEDCAEVYILNSHPNGNLVDDPLWATEEKAVCEKPI